jgi:hypothetical protein
MKKNKQSARSFTAFVVTWAFLILTITGIVLYIVPQGRIAYWTHWSLVGLGKEQWGDLHMIFGGVFIFAGVLHLWFNWKPFRKYFADRVKGHFELKQEVITSLLVTIVLAFMAIFSIPPVSYVFDLNDVIKDSWISSPDLEPPFGHAEEASLSGLARRMDLDLHKSLEALEQAGIKVESPGDSIEKIARENQLIPVDVYAVIRVHQLAQAPLDLNNMTAEEVEDRYSGTGIGRKSLQEISAMAGIDKTLATRRLGQAGYLVEEKDNLRAIADRYELSPIDVLKVILVEDYRVVEK